jgi:hypothetical protein
MLSESSVRRLQVAVRIIALVLFIYGASKMPGFNGVGFDPHKVSGTTLMLVAIFLAVLVRR